MAKKDPRVAKNLKTLERARNDFYDSLDAFDKKYGQGGIGSAAVNA